MEAIIYWILQILFLSILIAFFVWAYHKLGECSKRIGGWWKSKGHSNTTWIGALGFILITALAIWLSWVGCHIDIVYIDHTTNTYHYYEDCPKRDDENCDKAFIFQARKNYTPCDWCMKEKEFRSED